MRCGALRNHHGGHRINLHWRLRGGALRGNNGSEYIGVYGCVPNRELRGIGWSLKL